MCQANGKRLDVFMKAIKNKEYIDTLSNYHQMTVVYSEEGVNGGTWGHPSLAINLAAWISVDFQVWFNIQVLKVELVSTIDFSVFQSNYSNNLDDSGFVYLARSGATNWYKIGLSKQPYKRMSQLQVGTPLEITLIERVFSMNAPKLEKALHDYYEAYWLRGEWFDLPMVDVVIFEKIASKLDRVFESLPCLPQ